MKLPFVLGGIVGGLAMGAMTSHVLGIAICAMFGAAAGFVCGHVMDREEKRASERTRELDDIIGITNGSMGAPPGSIPPPPPDDSSELEIWAREWLTPPPPAVG